MSRSLVGQHSIVDFIIAQASSIHPDIDDQTTQVLKDSLQKFIHRMISYDDCSQTFLSCIGSSNPVDTLRDILEYDIDQRDPVQSSSSDSHDGRNSQYQVNDYDDSDGQSSSHSGRKRARPWNQQEDIRLLAGILHHGTDNWSLVSEIVGDTRTRAQCSQRWFRGLDPRISKKRWNPEEDKKLLEFVEEYGETAWAKIASSMGNRSDVQCRYHYQQLKKSSKKTGKHRSSNANASTAQHAQAHVQESQQTMAVPLKQKTSTTIPQTQSKPLVQPIISTNTPKITSVNPPAPVLTPITIRPIEFEIPTLRANFDQPLLINQFQQKHTQVQQMKVPAPQPIKPVPFLAPIEPPSYLSQRMFPPNASIDVFLHHFGL